MQSCLPPTSVSAELYGQIQGHSGSREQCGWLKLLLLAWPPIPSQRKILAPSNSLKKLLLIIRGTKIRIAASSQSAQRTGLPVFSSRNNWTWQLDCHFEHWC